MIQCWLILLVTPIMSGVVARPSPSSSAPEPLDGHQINPNSLISDRVTKVNSNNRLLQQSFQPPTPSTPIRLIDINDFIANLPAGTIENVPPPVPVGKAFSQLFDKFNAQITTKLNQQGISFTPFPPFPEDNSTNQVIQNNQASVSYSPPINSYPSQTSLFPQDTSNLPAIVPARPLVLPPTYQIVSATSPTNTNPVQIIVAPTPTPQLTPQQPIAITPTIISNNFFDQPQPRINPQSSIINAFRFRQIGNESHYIIQQADYNLDQNLVGVLLQLRDQKSNDLKNTSIIYAEFVYLMTTNVTNYNIIFKNSTSYIVAAIQLPYKLLNYNILSPSQINPLCGSFDSEGNCTSCSPRSYLSAYTICIAVNPRCQSYSSSTGSCTACYSGYSLNGGECVINPTIQGCLKTENNQCVSCMQRYYLQQDICKTISRLCVTWNATNGNCLSCYQGYRLQGGECLVR